MRATRRQHRRVLPLHPSAPGLPGASIRGELHERYPPPSRCWSHRSRRSGFAPALPASVQEAQVSKLFIKSALAVNTNIGTVTLPLHRGTSSGHTVWYVITESSDKEDAQRRGVNFSERMAHALGTKAVQRAHFVGGHIDFPGTVDFSPTRVVVPGPKGFPPAKFAPGAVGDAKYSPLATTDGRVVLNATQVANSSGKDCSRHCWVKAIR